jgi:broad specificity phosphatase PhoE
VIERIILVRHGETVHNVSGIAQGWNDSALSERGEKQVAAVAARVARLGADALFSSPLERAMTTARAIAGATSLPIVELDDLREMNYGKWEGRSFLEVRREEEDAYQRWIDDGDATCPGGESHNDVRARIERAIAAAEGARHPVLVTHGTAIRVAVTVLLGLPVLMARHFAQDNASINIFIRRGDRWVLKLWNDTTHWQG